MINHSVSPAGRQHGKAEMPVAISGEIGAKLACDVNCFRDLSLTPF